MPLAHRRLASRSKVVGKRWGMLDALEPLRVRNLSSSGMLVECPNPLEVGSIHEFQVIDGTTAVRVRAAVRHSSLMRRASAERYFLVGLEFLNLSARLSAVVERWLKRRPAQSIPREA